jgi:hypothetical protein
LPAFGRVSWPSSKAVADENCRVARSLCRWRRTIDFIGHSFFINGIFEENEMWTQELHMNKSQFETVFFIITLSIMSGCVANDEALHSALNNDTQAVSNLAREQAKMIASKASPSDVFDKVLQADPFLNEIRKICIKPEKGGNYPSNSCTFYKDLSFKFTLYMMMNAGKYYLKNGNKEKAEQILNEIVSRYNDEAFKAEVIQANFLLKKLKSWENLSSGMKAYILGDYNTALNVLKSKDDPESLYCVGDIYYFGYGVPRDIKQASEWYSKAAEKDYAPAEYQLGMLYLNGEGVEQDETEAKKLFQKAADQDYEQAKHIQGIRSK